MAHEALRPVNAATLADTFKIASAREVLRLEQFRRPQDQVGAEQIRWLAPDDPPALVLFISHRWETPHHPDPTGRQLSTIQGLLTTMRDIALAVVSETAQRRLDSIPSLRVHGRLQAAYLLGQECPGWQEVERVSFLNWVKALQEAGVEEELGDRILDGIGIWYDYISVPQKGMSGEPLSEPETQVLRRQLVQLPGLLRSCPVVALRETGDQYDARGWCASELSITNVTERRSWDNHVVLNLERFGEQIQVDELPDREDDSFFGLEYIYSALENWEDLTKDSVSNAIRLLGLGYSELRQAEESRIVPLYTTPRPPLAVPSHLPLLKRMIASLGGLTRTDLELGGTLPLGVDLGDLIVDALRSAGLDCTEEEDLIYVGLIILQARHMGAREVQQFYTACLARWMDGAHLVLARFRWELSFPDHHVWFRFADPGWPAEEPPTWARELDTD